MQPQQSMPSAGKPSKLGLVAAALAAAFLLAASFGAWAFLSRQDYKNSSERRASEAATAAKTAQAAELQAQFDKQLKEPYKNFAGANTFGSIKFNYPKTWSAYIDQSSSSEPINGYFYPGEVPGTSTNTAYALRIELMDGSYSSVIQQYQQQIQEGTLKASTYVPAKLAKTANVQRGTKLVGELDSTYKGAMIVIPVRDQTLMIYTQSNDYLGDFNSIVLPSLTFSP